MTLLHCGKCGKRAGEATRSKVGVSIRTREQLPDYMPSEFIWHPGLSVTCPYCATDLRVTEEILEETDRMVLDPH